MKRIFLIMAGTAALVLGVAGIFLPLLPTTPFLLLAAGCYMNSSPACYDRLIRHRFLGRYIRDYREGRGMTPAAKITTLVLLWGTIAISAVFAVRGGWRLVLFGVALGVTLHIHALKNAPAEKFPEEDALAENAWGKNVPAENHMPENAPPENSSAESALTENTPNGQGEAGSEMDQEGNALELPESGGALLKPASETFAFLDEAGNTLTESEQNA